MDATWLENIPTNWPLMRFGAIFTQRKKRNEALCRNFVLSVLKGRGVIPYKEKGDIGNKVSEDLSNYKFVNKGDFVLNSMNLYMGSVGVSKYSGITSTAYIVCTPSEDIIPEFYGFLIQARGFQEYAGQFGNGILEIREAVRWTALRNIKIPLPPLEEQREIAGFLDRETTKIDQQIERIALLQELLKEQRKSLITHAVSGQKPGVGVMTMNWTKTLPDHWDLKRLQIVGQIQLSNVDKHSQENELPVKLCNYTDVYHNEFITPELTLMRATASLPEIIKFHIVEGQILLTKDSETPDDIGNPALVKYSDDYTLCGYHLAQFTPDPAKLEGRYGRYCLASDKLNDQFKVSAKGVTRFAIGKREISDFLFPLPPLEEQREIADFLDRETTKIDQQIGLLTEIKERFSEKRAALITAAVTGQIAVS